MGAIANWIRNCTMGQEIALQVRKLQIGYVKCKLDYEIGKWSCGFDIANWIRQLQIGLGICKFD